MRIRRLSNSVLSIVQRYGVFLTAAFLLTFGLFFLFNGRAEIVDAFDLIASISPLWVLVLALLQVVVLFIGGWTYQVVLHRQGYRGLSVFRLVEIHLRRVVIGAVTPIGGPASVYVLVRALRPYKVKDSDSLILATIKGITGVIAFLIFLIPALLVQTPSTMVLIATAGLLLVLLVALVLLTMVLRTGDTPWFVERWAPVSALRFIASAKTHRMTAGDFVFPVILSFFSHMLTALMLLVGLLAIGYPAEINTVLIGYVVGKLFFMMAPVFQGIGLVEVGMALALQQAGLPSVVAVSSALLFRVGDLWLPLSWGFAIQFARLPLRSHLRDAREQAASLVAGSARALRESLESISHHIDPLARRALVTESPVTLTVGVLFAAAVGLPFTG